MYSLRSIVLLVIFAVPKISFCSTDANEAVLNLFSLKSWVYDDVESSSIDFPIQNLPYGVFSTKKDSDSDNINKWSKKRIGVAIGKYVLDLSILHDAGLFRQLPFDSTLLTDSTLNRFMALSPFHWKATRELLISYLAVHDCNQVVDLSNTTIYSLQCDLTLRSKALWLQSDVRMHLPVSIGDYTGITH